MKLLTGKERIKFLEKINRRKAFEAIRWYVIRTSSNQEERVANIFRNYGIEVFLPKAHYGWIEEQDKSYLLYPNLVYVHTSVEVLLDIMRCLGRPKYMSFCIDRTRPQDKDWMQLMTVSDESMEVFKNATACLSCKDCAFSIGDRVQITEGMWNGISGVVKDVNPTERLALIEGTVSAHIRFSARVSFDSIITIQDR